MEVKNEPSEKGGMQMTTSRVYHVIYGYAFEGGTGESTYDVGVLPVGREAVQRYVRGRFGYADTVQWYEVWDGTDPCDLHCVRPAGA